MTERKFDLEDRIIRFAVDVVNLTKLADWNDYASKYYQQQLIRSSGSVALNFGEFLGAKTNRDKLNKLSLALKEVMECRNNLLIQIGANLNENNELEKLAQEALELTKIIQSIIRNKT